MLHDGKPWRSRLIRLLAILLLLALLSQPETWHVALALDATALDALALLLEAQVTVFLVFVFRQSLLPAATTLWHRVLRPLGRAVVRDSALSVSIVEGCIRQLRGMHPPATRMR